MANPKKPEIPLHPLIASSAQPGQPPQPSVKFSGYVGTPSGPGKVRLYSTLDDLSHYLEFDEAAVVQTAPTPELLLPDNALSIWVDAGTPIRWVREYSKASDFANMIANTMVQAGSAGGMASPSIQ
jgi:hypothetical protein